MSDPESSGFGGDQVDYNPLFATNLRFATRGEAYEWAQNTASENGFAFVIANSGRKNRSQPELFSSYFRCSRYGSSKVVYDPDKPKRKSKTVKCRIKDWYFWNIITANGFDCHNHQPTKYKYGHRHYADLNEEEKAYVRQKYRARSSPEILKTNPDTHELTHVFMYHPKAVKLFRAYPHVVLIDSTYKTNTYNMALVEVVGVTPAGSSFLIACVLIPYESKEGYTWLLRKLMDLLECTGAPPSCFVTDRELGLVRALRTLFLETPHLLCRWHVNRAIEIRALKIHKTVFYKDHFVLCYTNEYFHLGNTTTSQVESAHSLLKAWLKIAHLTLDTMWSRIHSMLEAQHSKIRKELEDSMSRPLITHHLFSLLQGNVSTKAIEIMEDEVKRGIALGIGLELMCGCVLPTTHGLPCARTLIDLKNSGSRVHLSDIHPFWRTLEYDNEEAMPKNDNEMLEELVDKATKSDPAYQKVFLEKLRDILHPEDEDILASALRSHFDGWVDVGSDGHCGFCVLSHALCSGEEDYIQMRDWCLKEITGFGVYKDLFEAGVMGNNGLSKYENTLRRIRFTHQSGCGEDHWMRSDDFFVFASLFNWAICVVAENRYAKGPKEWQCMTILPLRISNEGVAPYGVLWILNHKSHWMRLHSKGPPNEVPMPPIKPAWIVFREPSVQHLATLYKTNIENWHTLMETTPREP
ncbi:hypothetical protein RND81_01G121000 [Saponaria officinalis]|uniref:MULE transposase domain-containing protein n=1 Tax=Saponaria officinalis TaxID=3572 RepID=A0AAW1N9K2_SAPOF